MVDRATFVIFSLQGHRFAVPVESVERVLRGAPARDAAMTGVEHGGRRVPLINLRAVLGFVRASSPAIESHALERTLVFTVEGAWVACPVDAVYEVATIDASTVELLTPGAEDSVRRPAAARARFTRHEQEVLVLDIVRVVRAVYEAAPRATRDEGASELRS